MTRSRQENTKTLTGWLFATKSRKVICELNIRQSAGKSHFVKISPAGIKYAMEATGWKVGELSKESGIPKETITGWIKAKNDADIIELRKISKIMNVSLLLFFIDDTPKIKYPKDKRVSKHGVFGKKLCRALMNAKFNQDGAATLMDYVKHSKYPSFDMDKKTIDKKTLTYWDLRNRIEQFNIFVMEDDMGNDADGIILTNDKKPVFIIINSKTKSKIQILANLYAHVLIKKDGICSLENNDDPVEKLCSLFAKNFMNAFDINDKSQKPQSYPDQTISEMVLKTLDKYGKKYITLLANQVGSINVTRADFIDYLNIDIKYLDEIIENVR